MGSINLSQGLQTRFKRDVSMIVPRKDFIAINPEVHDRINDAPLLVKPAFYDKQKPLREEDIILCKTEKEDASRFLAEVNRIFPDEVEVVNITTPKPLMDGYATAALHVRIDDLLKARFRKIWYVYSGKNAGKGTLKPSVPIQPQAATLDGETSHQRNRRPCTSYRHDSRPSGLFKQRISKYSCAANHRSRLYCNRR